MTPTKRILEPVKREDIPTISAFLHWGVARAAHQLVPEPESVLDMGGNGRMSCFFRCPVTNANILDGLDATALPFADSSFDVCTSVAVLEHVSDWRAFLSESVRVGRQGAAHWFPAGPIAGRVEKYKTRIGHHHPCVITDVEDIARFAGDICREFAIRPYMTVSEQMMLLATINPVVDRDETYELVAEIGSQEYGYLLTMKS